MIHLGHMKTPTGDVLLGSLDGELFYAVDTLSEDEIARARDAIAADPAMWKDSIVGPYERSLLEEEGVAIESGERACAVCSRNVVTSTKPDVDFCRSCFYTGAAHERLIAPLMEKLNGLEGVAGSAVWHTGGGCFNLAVRLNDGRLATPSEATYDDLAGRWWPEAAIPEADGKWAVVVSRTEEAWHDWDEDGGNVVLWPDAYDANELVEAVRQLAASPGALALEGMKV